MIEANITADTDIDLGEIGAFECTIVGSIESNDNGMSWSTQLDSCIVSIPDCKTEKFTDIEVIEYLTPSAEQTLREHLIEVWKDERDEY